MKKMMFLLTGLLVSTIAFADVKQEQAIKNLEQQAAVQAQRAQEKDTLQAKWSHFVEQHRQAFLTNAAQKEYDYSLKNCAQGVEIVMDKGTYTGAGSVFHKHLQREKISEGVSKQEKNERLHYFIQKGPVLMLYRLADDFYSHAESAAGKSLRWVSTDVEGHETSGEIFNSYPGYISIRCL